MVYDNIRINHDRPTIELKQMVHQHNEQNYVHDHIKIRMEMLANKDDQCMY
jgi:hypothetical protein